MSSILIVDDDIKLRKLVKTYAEFENMACDEAETGTVALQKLEGAVYDIVLLDVMMPGMDGFETLSVLREQSQVPVIMLTSRDEEYDKLLGFNLGADDYVPKPFSPKELMARVHAVLKRSSGDKKEELVFDTFVIVPSARKVSAGDTTFTLTPKEFDLLVYMAKNEKQVFSREQLLDKVWGYDYYGDIRTVDTHIKSLREHLGNYRQLIQTVWGVGYKFEKM